jgi:NTE family protein
MERTRSAGRIGLVLSGGGARGAYETGVLLHIAEQLPDVLARVSVITGTSVGAVNGAFLASRGLTPASVAELAELWRGLAIDGVMGFDRAGTRSLVKAGGLRLVGRQAKSPAVGVLRVDGIIRLVTEKVDWRGLKRSVRSGRFRAVAFAATDIATGATRLFVDHGDDVVPRWSRGGDAPKPERTPLAPSHVLASAAIPVLFPPVRVGARWYMDGGLRNNTPLSPALSLGADALLIVTVRAEEDARLGAPEGDFPGFGQVIGKVLDSVFLDRVGFDLDRLTRINDIVASVERLGPGLADRLREELARSHRPPYRSIPYAHVRPRQDLGALASDLLAQAARAGAFSFARVLKALFQDDTGTSGDAASFLFFDGSYADVLLRAGRADAEAAHDQLAKI